MSAVLGLDIGTSACKAVVVDDGLGILATHSVAHGESLSSPRPGWYDQDMAAVWRAVVECLRAVVREAGSAKVSAIGLAGQMHGLVALGADRQMLRPCINCMDARNGAECEEIHEAVGGRRDFVALTDNVMLPSCTGGKLLWMRKHEPTLYDRIWKAINPKDHIRFLLTGEVATDVSDASGTGLFDVRRRQWCWPLIDRLDIDPERMPRALESFEVAGRLMPQIAREIGLPAGIPVSAGGGDAIVQTLASGAVGKGRFCLNLGTGGVLAAPLTNCPENDDHGPQIYCAWERDRWVAYSGLLTVGAAVEWFASALYGDETKAEVAARLRQVTPEAARLPPGAGGLLFFPNLAGQRMPVEDVYSRGCLIGLTPAHDRRHVFRSLLEGIAFGMREIVPVLEQVSYPPSAICITGGGSQSDFWCQIVADIFDLPVERYAGYAHGGALGAAMVAGRGSGVWASVDEAAAAIVIDRIFTPSPVAVEAYADPIRAFSTLYPALRQTFPMLGRNGPAAHASGDTSPPPGGSPPPPRP